MKLTTDHLRDWVGSDHLTIDNLLTLLTDALNDAQKTALLTRIPTQRMGSPEDIAAAVVYLASNEAGWVTGQTLHVNGGMAMI
jgi:3-oxoacyl-[acyl-carrier protein] reductase